MTGEGEPRVGASIHLRVYGEVPFTHHYQPAGGPEVVHVNVDDLDHPAAWPSVGLAFDRAALAATIAYLSAVAAEWSGARGGGAR